MELLCGLPNTHLDVLFQQLIPRSSKYYNWLSCANFLRLMFYASVLAACLLLSLIRSMACFALPGMARRLEFPSSTSPVHYPEGCAAHSMALTRPWRVCVGLCMGVHWMLCTSYPNLELEFLTRMLIHRFLTNIFSVSMHWLPQIQKHEQVIYFILIVSVYPCV